MSKVLIYSPPSTAQIKRCSVDFDIRRDPPKIYLVQYDKTLPIVEVALNKGGTVYHLPEDAEVNIRMGKRNKLAVYNPVLGCNEDRDRVYVEITTQMTTQDGVFDPILELKIGSGIAGTSPILFVVQRNPVQDDAVIDETERKTIEEYARQARDSATAAAKSAEDAGESVRIIQDNKESIECIRENIDDIVAAGENAKKAESWAVGGTGTRDDEDENNSRYWAEKSAESANGFVGVFDAPEVLSAAYPTGTPGQIAVVLSTLSVWLWSGTASAWVDTAEHLYKATFLLDRWTGGASPYTQTVDLEPMDGGGPVSASSTLHSGPMADGTGDANANAVLISSLNRINNAESITLGDNTVTVRVPIKPVSDVPVVFRIKGAI